MIQQFTYCARSQRDQQVLLGVVFDPPALNRYFPMNCRREGNILAAEGLGLDDDVHTMIQFRSPGKVLRLPSVQ